MSIHHVLGEEESVARIHDALGLQASIGNGVEQEVACVVVVGAIVVDVVSTLGEQPVNVAKRTAYTNGRIMTVLRVLLGERRAPTESL